MGNIVSLVKSERADDGAAAEDRSLRGKVLALGSELGAIFQERDREIEGLITASLAGEHILLLGPPGTGKSMLAHAFAQALEGSFFAWLLTKFSTPEELFGPISMSGLKNDRYTRVASGKLQEAHFALLDEVFKANSAILNSLLTTLNERKFYDDGKAHAMPLVTAIGASNEMPDGTDLSALFDRFMLRYWVDYTKDPASFVHVLTMSEPSISTRISLSDWSAAQAEVAATKIDAGLPEAMFGLREELRREGIVASDRRWRKCLRLMQASAWLGGDAEVTTEHLSILSHALWQAPEQQPKIAAVLTRYASPELARAMEVYDAITQMSASLDPKSPRFAEEVPPVAREMVKALQRIKEMAATTNGTAKKKISALAMQLEANHAKLRKAFRDVVDL